MPKPVHANDVVEQEAEVVQEEVTKEASAEKPKAAPKKKPAKKAPAKAAPEKRERLVKAAVKDIDVGVAKKLIGFKEAEKGAHSYKRLDGTVLRFDMENNSNNRPFRMSRANELKAEILAGTFAGTSHSDRSGNGESWVVGTDGQVVSCAHRSVGLIIANEDRECMNKTKEGKAQLKKWGVNGSIVIQDQVVTTVCPKSADTNDKAKSRVLADVLFRRHEFSGKKYKQSDLVKLSRQLSVAVNHVIARSGGYTLRNSPKVTDLAAIEFVKKHPYLKKAVEFVYGLNEGASGSSEKVDQFQASVGFIAAHLYLAATQDGDYAAFAKSGAVRQLPNEEHWQWAQDFWSRFAVHASGEVGAKDTPSSVAALVKVYKESANKTSELGRDALCTVTTRAMKAYMSDQDITPKALRDKLRTETPPFERFGGLDQDRAELRAQGLVSDLSQHTVEKRVLRYLAAGPKTEKQITKYLGLEKLPSVLSKRTLFDVFQGEGEKEKSFSLTEAGKAAAEA